MVTQMREANCSNCEFYLSHMKVCRRYPPTPMVLGMKQGLGGNEPVISGYFPQMMPTGWCGEHRPVPNLENDYDGTA